jgi:hypothetical protein
MSTTLYLSYAQKPVYNADILYNTNIDPNLANNTQTGSVLYYDGINWTAGT